MNEIKNKMPGITSVATNTALTAVENDLMVVNISLLQNLIS